MSDRHEIQDVLSRYVRATDEGNGVAQAKLFTDEGMIRFFGRSGTGQYLQAGEPLVGATDIRHSVENRRLRERTYLHHVTTDHIIEVDGGEATMNAQFVVWSAVAEPEPPDGRWPGPPGVRGGIAPIMIGFYDSALRRSDGAWKFTRLDVMHSLPVVGL
ncbi:nuclear transport factor 2 family protein [Streptosporangium sp. 'caverna']|uniref:nuclear transport factor 2 family protein n=1 Tax=Streptosporangium sp. 'caverna' TaxID=2202249 RepID=UPI0013A6ABE9|nr:nuclear transport factor 2 family protein [Streptosporangium sp. 'caverna']